MGNNDFIIYFYNFSIGSKVLFLTIIFKIDATYRRF